MRDREFKFTLRQWARTYATYIHTIAERFSIQGDLAKIIGRADNSLSLEESYWCSNFQMDNFHCPDRIKNLIKQHFESLFPRRTTD